MPGELCRGQATVGTTLRQQVDDAAQVPVRLMLVAPFADCAVALEECFGCLLAMIEREIPLMWPMSTPAGPREAVVQSTTPLSRPSSQSVLPGW
jgi:hypothetical protein